MSKVLQEIVDTLQAFAIFIFAVASTTALLCTPMGLAAAPALITWFGTRAATSDAATLAYA